MFKPKAICAKDKKMLVFSEVDVKKPSPSKSPLKEKKKLKMEPLFFSNQSQPAITPITQIPQSRKNEERFSMT